MTTFKRNAIFKRNLTTNDTESWKDNMSNARRHLGGSTRHKYASFQTVCPPNADCSSLQTTKKSKRSIKTQRRFESIRLAARKIAEERKGRDLFQKILYWKVCGRVRKMYLDALGRMRCPFFVCHAAFTALRLPGSGSQGGVVFELCWLELNYLTI